MEHILTSEEYTPEIQSHIYQIKNRMRNTLIEFTDKDIIVVENEGVIYILGNPVLGRDPVFDEFGNFKEFIDLYNITIIDNGPIRTELNNGKLTFFKPIPTLRILRPELCARILPNA